ncbi:hypothetical protein ACVGWR_00170, partial [Enterobacter hormaechei]
NSDSTPGVPVICCATSKGNMIALTVAKIEREIREGGRSRSGGASLIYTSPSTLKKIIKQQKPLII